MSPKMKVMAFGNPLLDIVVQVDVEEEENLVSRFGLLKHLGQETDTSELLAALKNKEKTFGLGGCALNTCRVLRWLDSTKNINLEFYGGVGSDDNHTNLEMLINQDRVTTRFAIYEQKPTGHCVALVCEDERTLCASLGAANHFSMEDFSNLQAEKEVLRSDLVYTTSFFASHSWNVTNHLSKICASNKVKLAFNLSGEYICQERSFVERMLQMWTKIDFLFGNKGEFRTLLRTLGEIGKETPLSKCIRMILDEDQEDFQTETCAKEQLCTVILTHGPEPIIYGQINLQTYQLALKRSIPVPKMLPSDIKDTIGAGDSFTAGFLYGILQSKPFDACVDKGIYVAQKVMREVGSQLPKEEHQDI